MVATEFDRKLIEARDSGILNPSKWKKYELVWRLLAKGRPVLHACQYALLHKDIYYAVKKKHPVLQEMHEIAMATGTEHMVAECEKDPQGRRMLLEKSRPLYSKCRDKVVAITCEHNVLKIIPDKTVDVGVKVAKLTEELCKKRITNVEYDLLMKAIKNLHPDYFKHENSTSPTVTAIVNLPDNGRIKPK